MHLRESEQDLPGMLAMTKCLSMPTLDYYTKSAMCPDATTSPLTMSCIEICHGFSSPWLRLCLADKVMHHETDTQQIHNRYTTDF